MTDHADFSLVTLKTPNPKSTVCAASLVVSLPVLIAGFAAQDKLVQGLSMGAVR